MSNDANEWREKWRLRLQAVQAIGVLVTIVALFVACVSLSVAYCQFRDFHELNRRAKAAEILSRFNAEVGPHRDVVVRAFPKINDPDSATAPSFIHCQRIARASAPAEKIPGITDDALELQRHINSVFNYFEDVAISWDNSIADEKMLDDSIGPLLLKWYDVLAEYDRAIIENYGGQSPHPSLDNYVQHLRDLKLKKANPRRPQMG